MTRAKPVIVCSALIAATLSLGAVQAVAQPASGGAVSMASGATGLTAGEERWFDQRLATAADAGERTEITRERDALIAERRANPNATVTVPPGGRENAEDLIMPNVPTPRGDRGQSLLMPGRGAMAPTEAGSSLPLSGGGAFGEGDR